MEPADVAIRPLTVSDSESTAALVTQLGYPTTPQQIASRLDTLISDPDYALFAATHRQQVIGIVGARIGHALEFDQPYARLIGLAVDEPFRGSGVGKMLMQHIEVWAKGHGAVMLLLTSGSHRTEAHQFYERIGYARTGTRFAKQL
jgi:GNAT superfamily N-acetyltransferase